MAVDMSEEENKLLYWELKCEQLEEKLTTLQAEKEKAGECPHCEGDGEIYVGSSAPEDDGHEQCITCGGEGRLPDADKIKTLQLDALNYYYECEGAKIQIAERDERIERLEGELGRLTNPQPIETAPKDGSHFLIVYNDGEIRMGHYLDNSDKQYPWAGYRSFYGSVGITRKMVGWLPIPTQEPTNGS